jgi:hypothetical protein
MASIWNFEAKSSVLQDKKRFDPNCKMRGNTCEQTQKFSIKIKTRVAWKTFTIEHPKRARSGSELVEVFGFSPTGFCCFLE